MSLCTLNFIAHFFDVFLSIDISDRFGGDGQSISFDPSTLGSKYIFPKPKISSLFTFGSGLILILDPRLL